MNIPPPPPPPSMPLSPNYKDQVSFLPKIKPGNDLPEAKIEVSSLCKNMWITLSGMEDVKLLSIYAQIKPVTQDGPTCGLVALQMAQQLVQSEIITAENLLVEAKRLGFTTSGEMFSAQNMRIMAERFAHCNGEVVPWSNTRLLSHLSRGKPALVAYDADFNHEPALKNGHSAHWAVLTGFILILDNLNIAQGLKITEDANLPSLYHFEDEPTRLMPILNGIEPDRDPGEIYVTARHGKSRFLALWPLNTLESSNKNLKEMSPKHSEDNFVLPPAGVKEGLSNKMLLLY